MPIGRGTMGETSGAENAVVTPLDGMSANNVMFMVGLGIAGFACVLGAALLVAVLWRRQHNRSAAAAAAALESAALGGGFGRATAAMFLRLRK